MHLYHAHAPRLLVEEVDVLGDDGAEQALELEPRQDAVDDGWALFVQVVDKVLCHRIVKTGVFEKEGKIEDFLRIDALVEAIFPTEIPYARESAYARAREGHAMAGSGAVVPNNL